MSRILKLKYFKLLWCERVFLVLAVVLLSNPTIGKTETLNWSIGLHCKSNLPDPKLDSFFIVEEKKRFIKVVRFNNDRVNFYEPPIALSITPKEFYNRPEGLTINRETLVMKWRNSKKLCYLKDIQSLEQLAQQHLLLLLKDNKL
jgi:hypothetical protein